MFSRRNEVGDPLYMLLSNAVRRAFRKKTRLLGLIPWKSPTVTKANLDMVVMPLYEAVRDSANSEEGLSFDDVKKAIYLLKPDYRFTTSPSTILNIAELVRASRTGAITSSPEETMQRLNTAQYDSSSQYYRAVADAVFNLGLPVRR